MKQIVQIITEESVRKAVARSGVIRGLIRYIKMRWDLLFGDGWTSRAARMISWNSRCKLILVELLRAARRSLEISNVNL